MIQTISWLGLKDWNQRQTHNLSDVIKVIIKSQIIRDSKSGESQRLVPSLFFSLKASTDLIVSKLILNLKLLYHKSFLQIDRDVRNKSTESATLSIFLVVYDNQMTPNLIVGFLMTLKTFTFRRLRSLCDRNNLIIP